jgi:hypothetical protein
MKKGGKPSRLLHGFVLLPLAAVAKYALGIWVFGLIWYSLPLRSGGLPNAMLAIVWFAALVAIPIRIKDRGKRRLALAALFLIPFVCRSFIRPSNDRDWVPSCAHTPYAEVSGDSVTIRHFRSFDYGEDGSPISHWSDRSFDLRNLRGMDVFMTHWASEWAGHPIFSFDFGPQGHLAFTIEARLEKNESYSLLKGLYRQFELTYIPCDESDAVRVRTNFRENEDVHLYRTIATPEKARERFLEFIRTTNSLREKPRFYNVLTSNCTTAVRAQMMDHFPMDWRVIMNGKLDELLYERGLLESAGLPFPKLRERTYINPIARESHGEAGFSERIRKGVPGFD